MNLQDLEWDIERDKVYYQPYLDTDNTLPFLGIKSYHGSELIAYKSKHPSFKRYINSELPFFESADEAEQELESMVEEFIDTLKDDLNDCEIIRKPTPFIDPNQTVLKL